MRVLNKMIATNRTLLKNKKAMPISIAFFVLATFVLAATAIVALNFRGLDINEQVTSGIDLEKAYSRAEILNYYLRDVASGITSKDNPVGDFQAGLSRYRNKEGQIIPLDLRLVESQIDEQHIGIENGNKLAVNFDISILETTQFKDVTKGGLNKVNYTYVFSYSKIVA